jgi:hypothetical protein
LFDAALLSRMAFPSTILECRHAPSQAPRLGTLLL